MEGFGWVFLLNSLPPEIAKNRTDFLNELFFGEKNVLHVVNSDRIDYRMNIRETTCMVEFVGFEASKFCS
jgi:hypothetical protein